MNSKSHTPLGYEYEAITSAIRIGTPSSISYMLTVRVGTLAFVGLKLAIGIGARIGLKLLSVNPCDVHEGQLGRRILQMVKVVFDVIAKYVDLST